MAYRELINVAQGTKGQLDACISALDTHDNPPDEVEALTMKLEEAMQICETIITKGQDEPEEPEAQPAAAEPEASPEPAPEAPAEDTGTIFDDPSATL